MTARSWQRFSPVKGMLTVVASIRREHVEAFVAAELERTAPSSDTTRYRLPQHLFKWLDDERGIISLHSGTNQNRNRSRTLASGTYAWTACWVKGSVF
jgi:hypothetical protein